MKQTAWIVAIRCAAILVCAALLGDSALQGARPLADRVLIRRDTYGVPHILGETEEAAAFGLGYAQAEDHMPELGRRYLISRGEAARVFGRDQLDSDFSMRRVDNYAESTRALREVSRGFRRVLAAFAAGVNHYVAQHRNELPAWVPEVTAADLLANMRSGAINGAIGQGIVNDLKRKYEPGASTPPTPSAEADGSNALALSPSRTTTGRPILLGNPHLRWSSLYWEAHVTVPKRLNFYGSTLVGLPVLRAGFNDRLGYVQTNNSPDLTDVYALTLDAAQPDRYVFEGKPRPISRHTIAVEVKQPDGSFLTERREFEHTDLGPVIYRAAGRAFVVRSMALEAWRYTEGFQQLMGSRDLDDFLGRLERNLIPTSNFTYADSDGNVLYQWNARLPRRRIDGTSYELDVPGDSRRYMWEGLHDVADLPRLLNPPGGYLQNANNSPWWTSMRDRILPEKFPPYVEREPLGLRPQRLLQMLEGRERFGVDDVRALKFDTKVLLADRVLPALFAEGRDGDEPSADLREGLDVLQAWDRQATPTSRGAELFLQFWTMYSRAVPEPFAEPWRESDPTTTPRGLANPGVALESLERAVRQTRERHGDVAVPFGTVARFRMGEVELPGDGMAGGLGLYRVMTFEARPADKVRIAGRPEPSKPPLGFGDAWVLLVSFDQPVKAWSVLAYGQSSNPASPHMRDQIGLFAAHRLRPVWFTEAEIAANLERSHQP